MPAPNPQAHSLPNRIAWEPSPAHHTETADQTATPSPSPSQQPLQPLLTTRVTPGQCWVQAVIYPLPKKEPLPIVVQDGATTFEVSPAQLAKTQKEVIIREGGTTYRIEPPVYKAVTEKVLVKPEIRRTITIPPVYETRTETVVIEAERTILERCRIPGVNRLLEGAVQPLCARTLPAKTKNVERRVLVKPPTTKVEVIPAEYKEVTRWVLDKPARAVPVEIQPTIQKIPALTLAQPERVEERAMPPKVIELIKTLYEGEPQVALRQALCNSDITPELVRALQAKLQASGYDPGPIDGKLGIATSRAMIAYQRDHGLAAGALTVETLEHFQIPLP
ncbi:peptidoglycan-binding domain-containing protein [Hydrogenophilus thiooxidans]|uniref:peptidoglycan-binding domain-containing protein n=1 Tax=Hydrogenophilus thiooxidans TaxID=2820326 RepID=UPI001C218107|nr:peptidoglycan-binding domain-containing protein [Hydrogenophilus thiooxidans]